MAAPLLPTRPQKPLDLGLFDMAARDQLDLFGISGRAQRAEARKPAANLKIRIGPRAAPPGARPNLQTEAIT